MKKFITFLSLSFLMFSCDVANQVMGTYQLTQCKYEYQSISGLTLAGINLQNANGLASLNPLSLASLTSAFSSKNGSLPFNFTLNLGISNPNIQAAIINGLGYILEVDGHELTTGTVDKHLQIDGGQRSVLPINMAFDLKKALNGESMESIKRLAFNFAGIGNETSNVTIRIKPNFKVGNQIIAAPNYIPVSFQLNK